ncbi:hypothetical protein EMIT0373P_50246 [Pseudomonas chlororaphis]
MTWICIVLPLFQLARERNRVPLRAYFLRPLGYRVGQSAEQFNPLKKINIYSQIKPDKEQKRC